MKFLLIALLFFTVEAFAADQFSPTQQLTQAVSTTSVSYVAANKARKYLRVRNLDGTIVVYVKIGSIHSAVEGVKLSAGEIWEPRVVPAGSIWIKSASGTPSVEIVEGV
jgi:hypothetical protein